MSLTSPTTATVRPDETTCGPISGDWGRIGIWVGITALGLILLIAGINHSQTEPGLIVFGAMVTSAGVSGLLGLAHDPDSSGLMFALFGFFVPGYSLPFLIFYAVKGMYARADYRDRMERERAREQAEMEAGLRCPHCGLLNEGRHASRCPDFVHEVGLVVYDRGEWLFSGGAYVPPSEEYEVRCSCGEHTGRCHSREAAVSAFRYSHRDTGLRVVPEVRVHA